MKILILFRTPNSLKETKFEEKGRLQGHEVITAHFDDVLIHFAQPTQIFVKNHPLESFEAVLFRTSKDFFELISIMTNYCQKNKIPVYDKMFELQTTLEYGKGFESLKLSEQQLPFIHSSAHVGKNLATAIGQDTHFPVILKMSTEDRGEGVFLVKDAAELQMITEKHPTVLFLVQPFIENEGDVRVIVIGDQAIGAIKRSRSMQGEFRNNASLGGKTEVFPLTEQLKKTAVLATQAVNLDFAGIDFIFDPQDQHWKIMEINNEPQFDSFEKTTGIDVITLLYQYIAEKR